MFLTAPPPLAPLPRRQPRAFHWGIHSLSPLATYWLSVISSTEHGRFSDSSPRITAMSSMRLFVVDRSPPDSLFRLPVGTCSRMNAQPPGPGFPLQAPSV